ncbi:MAG: hypothetical protein J1E64_15380 [Acetatifactor sp.]|nr:hypothetical protein [Acetatifactor sp.]
MLHFGMNMPFYLMALYGSIMIVMVLILRALLKNRLPKFVFPLLWSLVMLRFLVPFSISIPLSMPVPANPLPNDNMASAVVLVQDQDSLTPAVPGTAHTVWEQGAVSTTAETTIAYGDSMGPYYTPFVWEDIIPVAYILGLLVTAGILGWQKYAYAQKLKNGFLVEQNETVNTILRSMGMGHVLVFTSDGIATPLVCGLLNPRIYLPTQMDFQNKMLLRHVLVHETTHIRRRDNWMKGILLIVLCLNWYNPLVWLMAVCLASDLEAACDAAVLKTCGEEERKDYAASLLAMALTGRRTTLLYSAFSKTEVEKRVKNILRYKRVTAFALLFTVLFLTGSMVAFAAVGQAPFLEDLTSFCASDSSRWGVRVTLARDIALGERAQDRAESVIFSILRMDDTNDPKVIEDRIRAELAEKFGVEKGAFHIELQLCLSREELEEEYAAWDITRAKDGFWMYQGQPIRIYKDKMLGAYQSREEGTVDISVQRDELGEIISVIVWRQGDPEFDDRTRRIREYRWYSSGAEITEVFENRPVLLEGNGKLSLFDHDYYEYYLSKEELIADIEQGYIFKVDTAFTKEVDPEGTKYVAPYVSRGNWPFYVHEENTVNLEIAFSDLLTKSNKNIFPGSERIMVDVISPDGQSVYHFEKEGDEITEDTSIQEQIPVTPGEWTLQVSFAYVCGEIPARLNIAAAYETPSEEDINWLKEERLRK